MSDPIAYTPQTAAAALGVSQDLIRKAVNAGVIKAKRTGATNPDGRQTGRILIARGDLLDWFHGLEDQAAAS